ncbi:LPXTG cell wall anchor domain-containing protein [Streptomyces mesophilus]|uniref:LPXTG cell wall anchor domain-containing protein n=1 Tax=Streptomyces mesophilus TaxID=1775132 RepID=UPI0019D15776|nr:LPXTG cell wall anchor domain-containing protein [Streptomyces mesophilus]
MNLRRVLAVTVAAAVTTPAAFAVAAPAFASAPSVIRAAERPTYEQLKQAAADAKKAYDQAVTAKNDLYEALEADSSPLKLAKDTAEQAAKDAAAARTAAEQKVTDAKDALDKAETDADKAEARKALDEAEEALVKAEEAKTKADETAKAASDAYYDERVAMVRDYEKAKKAVTTAETALKDADAALKAAGESVRENGLTSLAHGLPSKVVAGTEVDFTVRITNGTERTLSVDPLVLVSARAYKDSPVTVQWSDGSAWHTLDTGTQHVDRIESMKPGATSDVRLRVEFDAESKGGDAVALFAADASDAYNPSIHGPMKRYDFEVLPAGSKPGDVEDAEPVTPDADDDQRPGAEDGKGDDNGKQPQGDASEPATDADGNLASTGASSSPTQIALAAAGAVALGGGAVYLVRRRRTLAG